VGQAEKEDFTKVLEILVEKVVGLQEAEQAVDIQTAQRQLAQAAEEAVEQARVVHSLQITWI
jgi:hypothetical protein